MHALLTTGLSPMTTTIFAGILVLMIVALAFEEKLHAKKSLITGSFALLCLFVANALAIIPGEAVVRIGDHALKLPIYIPAIDWGVIAIILGSSLFVDVTARSGLFTYVAIKLTKRSQGDPRKLLIYYGLMTVLFSAVLNNVTAMIIIGSLTAVSLAKLDRTDKLLGFLLVEGLLTNVGGLLTLISSVPNIIVGDAAGISFVSFFCFAGPYVALCTAITIWTGARWFDIRSLCDARERQLAAQRVAAFDERDGVASIGFFWFAAAMTVLFIVAMATTSALPVFRELGLGFVALLFALIMLLRYKTEVDAFYKALDWDLLAFFAALFVVISVMEQAQVLDLIGRAIAPLIGLGPALGAASLLICAATFSSVTDNIPLAAMLAKILTKLHTNSASPLWWSVVFGANLGGNITPIGSASTLVAVTIIHKHGLRLSFGGFVKRALPFALLQLALAIGYLLVLL
ncbi:MAG: hypothetical protein H6707_18780 [Deltaproteobacteria bacterium]|nr:hypothetical protein [Deltaproteobacteria bacterium]